MKILLAGGAGYVGAALVPELLEQGYEVKVIDSLWFGNNLPKEIPVEKKDLFSCKVEDFKDFDQVIFLAGLSNDPMAEYDPALNFVSNASVPAYIAFLAKTAGVKRFIYASSCSVYGYAQDKFYTEKDDTDCDYPYGISKLQGETGSLQLKDENFSVIVLRQGTISGYSPRMRLDLVVNTMFKSALAEGKIKVNNPSIWRPILDIRDAITAYIRAIQAEQKINGIFNIASNNYTIGSVGETVKVELEKALNTKLKLELNDMKDFRNYKVSTYKAETILGFHPKHAISDIVKNLLDNKQEFLENSNDDKYYNIKTFKKIKQFK